MDGRFTPKASIQADTYARDTKARRRSNPGTGLFCQ